MIRRLLLPVIVFIVVAIGTVAGWVSLRDHDADQVARIAESESYATRSQLVRNIDTALAALTNVRVFWTRYGHLPRDQWASDAGIELAHFPGLQKIIWDDPSRDKRFEHSADKAVFDYRPDDTDWRSRSELITRLRAAASNTMAGPFRNGDGHAMIEIYVLNEFDPDAGRVAAIVDAHTMLENLLLDESPGYAITVKWGEELLYQRGEPADAIREDWTRSGLIRTSSGAVWQVVHTPDRELAKSLTAPAIDAMLIAGLLIALLMGLLTFENSRARSRATAAEKAEQTLAALNLDLEQAVAERTAELAERTADLQNISDSVAHDLRNPLNTISLNIQLLATLNEGALSPEHNDILRKVNGSIRQMSVILDRLLGLSAVAHSTFDRQPLDMVSLVKQVFEDLLEAESSRDVDFSIADLPATKADHKLVEILVMNLLSNALKYTRSQPERRIKVGYEDQNGVNVYYISDNGTGFDPQDSERLFVAFQRLEQHQSVDGVGLGLTIAARVVKRHRGRIYANGAPGEGATFYFSLDAPD